MTDVTLVLLPREYVEYAQQNARWLLFFAPFIGAFLETTLPLPFVLSAILELLCVVVGAFARHHAPDLDSLLHPPYSLAVMGGLCLVAFLARVSSGSSTLMIYAAFTLAGYTFVASIEKRSRQMNAYRAHVGQQQ